MADNEAIVREFIAAWGHGDARKLADFFTDDAAVWNDDMNTRHGREAIQEHYKGQLALITDCDFEITALAAADNPVFTERIDRMKITAAPIELPVAGVFDIATDGKISGWRDDFDLNQVMQQIQAA